MAEQKETHSEIAERLRSAVIARDFTLVGPFFASDVRFGTCVGRAQVIEYLARVFSHVSIEAVDTVARADRVVAMLDLGAREGNELPLGKRRHIAVLFVRDARVVELQLVATAEEALRASVSSPPPARPSKSTKITRFAAVLPVRDLAAALQHYERLGFAVRAYQAGGYGYAERDGLNLHFSVASNLDPGRTTSAVCLYVDDAGLLFAEWRSAGVSGQFFEPHDTEYGLREGAHID